MKTAHKTGFRSIGLSIFFVSWLFSSGLHGQTPTPAPTSSPPAFTLYHNDPPSSGGIDTALIGLISAASDSGDTIDFCMYNLNETEIVNALIAAHNGGATVRVISEADNAYSDEEYTQFKPAYQALVDTGIIVRTNAQSKTGLMHNKFVIFNGLTVWTGSWNATNEGTTEDSSDAVLIDSPELSQAYRTEFEEMWGGSYGTYKTDNTGHQFTIGGVAVECYFAPSDGVNAQIVEEIDAAQSNIYFLMYSFTAGGYGSAAEAMVEKAAGPGEIKVMGVIDRQQGLSAYSQLPYFQRNGVPVKLDTFPGLLHHKLIIIDRGGADPRVITGSYNLTASAEEDNDENTVIIHSEELADVYYYLFDGIYADHAEFPPPLAQGSLVLNEILANGVFRFFDIADPSNWGRSGDEEGSSPGRENVVDAVPPRIIHEPITDVLVGRPIYVHCRIEDNLYLYSAVEPTLYYRPVTDPAQGYTSVRMGALFDDYYGVIPAASVAEAGEDKVEYYITAKDASHNLGSAPPVNAALHPYAVDVHEAGPSDKVAITEIMFDPPDSPESNYEWVEMFNASTDAVVSLEGWKFTDFDGTYEFDEEASIDPGELQILCNNLASFTATHPDLPLGMVVYEYGSYSSGEITLPNSWGIVSGAVALVNDSGLIVHEVDYSSGWGGQNGTGPNENTLEKLDPAGPDDGTYWMCSMGRGGTPGIASSPHYIFTKYGTGGGATVTRPGIWLDKTEIDPVNPANNTATISYRLDRECQVTVEIYNPPSWDTPPEQCFSAPYLVRTLVPGALRGENMDLVELPHEEPWDGLDNDENPVYGVCRVLVKAVDPGIPGAVCRAESDDTVAAASWAAYDPDEFNVTSRQMVNVRYSLTKPSHVTLKFKYQLPGETVWNYITVFERNLCPRPEGSPAEVAAKTITNGYLWDGTDNNGNWIRPGLDYKIDLEAAGDIYGNVILAKDGRLSIPTLVLSPRSFFDPYGDEEEDISYLLSKDCHVTLTIVAPDGSAVRTLVDNQFQTAGLRGPISWDGRDDEEDLVPDGKYIVALKAVTDMGESCRSVAETVVCSISDPDWTPTQLE